MKKGKVNLVCVRDHLEDRINAKYLDPTQIEGIDVNVVGRTVVNMKSGHSMIFRDIAVSTFLSRLAKMERVTLTLPE
jgi:hypothetical protein